MSNYFSMEAFDYDDIQLVPNKGIIKSRRDADTSVKFGNRTFKIPVVPANMESVIDDNLAIWLAQNDYYYVMHRFEPEKRIPFIKMMHQKGLFASISVGIKDSEYDFIDPLRQACDVAYYDSPWNEYDNFEDEVFRRVEEELEKLTPRAQDVIRKIYLEGMKYKDVADKLGISVATVNSILVRALKKLRQQADNKDELAIYLFFLEKSLISEQ